MSEFVTRFLSMILLATSLGVTLVLVLLGYQVAIMLMEQGLFSGVMSRIAIAAFPSLFALGALPFWLVLRRMGERKMQ